MPEEEPVLDDKSTCVGAPAVFPRQKTGRGRSLLRVLGERALICDLPLPRFCRSVIRRLHGLGVLGVELASLFSKWLVVSPVMRSIADVGARLQIERIPYVRGKGRIVLGSDVRISGEITVTFSSHAKEPPLLRIGNGTFIGSRCGFSAAREILIGADCLIGAHVRIQDNDGHSLDPELRKAGCPVAVEDVRPVVVEDGAWIAAGAIILKGVRVGRDAVVGAGAVVTTDVPPRTVVAGNPARIVKRLDETAQE